jgi:hypothetical protein
MENNLVENNLVENNLMENNLVENNLVENNLVENNLVENNLVENNLVENNLVENNLVENNLVENNLVENINLETIKEHETFGCIEGHEIDVLLDDEKIGYLKLAIRNGRHSWNGYVFNVKKHIYDYYDDDGLDSDDDQHTATFNSNVEFLVLPVEISWAGCDDNYESMIGWTYLHSPQNYITIEQAKNDLHTVWKICCEHKD